MARFVLQDALCAFKWGDYDYLRGVIYNLIYNGSGFEDFLRELKTFAHLPAEKELQQIHIKHK